MQKMILTKELLELPVTDIAHVVNEINAQRWVEQKIRQAQAHGRKISRERREINRWRNKE